MNKKDEVLKKLRKRGDPGKKKTKRKLLLDDIEPEVKQSHEVKKKQIRKVKAENREENENDYIEEERFDADADKDLECCSCWDLTKYIIFIAIFFAVMIFLKQGQEQYAWGDRLRQRSREMNQGKEINFYEVMELDTTATQREIKQQYNKLAIQYHPDRNRGCEDCTELMEELNKAYETLRDEEKRAIYDQTFGSFDAITSAAVELTADNYDDYVTNSDKMWIIQVYAEWYQLCKAFSPVWEDTVRALEDYVEFGRVHSSKQSSLVRRLPAAVRVHPTIFSMMNGKLVNTYDLVRNPRDIISAITRDYPNYVINAPPKTMHIMKKKFHRRASFVNAIVITSLKSKPSIKIKALALKYHGLVQIGYAHPKEGSKRKRFLGQALEAEFGLETLPTLPAAFIYSGGQSDWVDAVISKRNVERIVKDFLAKRVPRFTHTIFSNLCIGDKGYVCVLLLQNCGDEKPDVGKNKEDLKFFKKTLALNTMEDVNLNKELLAPRRIQFGWVDVSKTKSLQPYCASELGTSQLVAVFDGNERYTRMPNYEALENLFQWLHQTFEGTSRFDITRAPKVQSVATPRLSYYIQIREFVDDFNWKDKENLTNLAILGTLVAGCVGAFFLGLKGVVMMIFLAGMFGGALQSFMTPQ